MALPTPAQVLSGGYTLRGQPTLITAAATASSVASGFTATLRGQPYLIFPNSTPGTTDTAAPPRFFLMF